MKISILILILAIFFTACTYIPASHTVRTSNRNVMPPGQAKKAYGTPSAKPFAPGQNKKHKR